MLKELPNKKVAPFPYTLTLRRLEVLAIDLNSQFKRLFAEVDRVCNQHFRGAAYSS